MIYSSRRPLRDLAQVLMRRSCRHPDKFLTKRSLHDPVQVLNRRSCGDRGVILSKRSLLLWAVLGRFWSQDLVRSAPAAGPFMKIF